MTVLQQQCLLTYLGYNPGTIDGVDGAKTKAARDKFRSDMGTEIDTLGSAITQAIAQTCTSTNTELTPVQHESASFWVEIKHFKREEFRCKCGGKYCNGFPAEPAEKLVRIADEIREKLGAPATVSSGLRCETWNAIQGGVPTSRHRTGCAMDFCVKGVPSGKLDALIGSYRDIAYHYNIDSSFCHMDVIL